MSVFTAIPHPTVPGTIVRFQGQKTPVIPPAAADTVMVPLVHDWGPIGTDPPGIDGRSGGPQEIQQFSQWTSLFGDSDTPGRTAVAGAFIGQNLPGALGAGAVVAYRLAGTGKAKATATINSTGGAVAALTLTAIYYGTRGDNFSYVVDVDPNNSANDRLRILYLGTVVETYTYAQTDVTGLAAQINLVSKVVRAVDVEGSAARLAAGSASLAGGNDGATLTPADHIAALTALRLTSASWLSPYDVTDSQTQAAYLSWAQSQAAACRPVKVVLGGAAGESTATAVTRAASLNDEHVITFGVGTWHDDLLDKDLSTSQLAPRLAGILAAKGQTTAGTSAKIGGLHNVGGNGPDDDELATCVTSGVVCLAPAAAADADVRIAKAVTTYTGDTASKPNDVYGDPRLVGVMDNYVRAMKEWGDDTAVGKPVNEDLRNTVYGEARRLQGDLLKAGLILPGAPAATPPIPAPFVNVINTDDDPEFADTVPYEFGWQFAKTANAILASGTVI